MTTSIVLFGILAIALSVALFQYKPWTSGNIYWVLTAVRTLSLSTLFILLFNPEISSETTTLIKPKLAVLVDNSQSIAFLGKDSLAQDFSTQLKNHTALNNKFDVQFFSFAQSTSQTDTFTFDAPQTNIGQALLDTQELFRDEVAPIALITDGHQTIGASYKYLAKQLDQTVYPLVLGDTTQYKDLSIKQINVNAYAFLDNSFPVEIFINYNGNSEVSTELELYSEKQMVLREKVVLSSTENTVIVTPKLKADRVGVKRYTARLRPLKDEKILTNNRKPFALEIINQKLDIALVSNKTHPDLGVFKSIIGAQKNYSIQRFTTDEFMNNPKDCAFVVLYQPDARFSNVYAYIQKKNINTFTVGGSATDWAFLNSIQNQYTQQRTEQMEEYQAVFNTDFDAFAITPLAFENFPPLESEFGSIDIRVPHEVLLHKSINGMSTKAPLLFVYTNDNSRHAVLLGTEFWKWRLKAYQLADRFDSFDAFFNVLFQYLSTQKKAQRLLVTHEPVFDGSNAIEIFAQFFDENFQFNPNAQLEIEVDGQQLNQPLLFPLSLFENTYNVDLSGLKPGKYNYKLRTTDRLFSTAGRFEILDFNIENQFLNANYNPLSQLAKETAGRVFLENQYNDFITQLLKNSNYKSIQKINKKAVPLIDYKWLLLFLILSLATEWFIRKYNGLI